MLPTCFRTATSALFLFAATLSAQPVLTSLSVTQSYPPCAPFDITISGTGFSPTAQTLFGESVLATTFVSDTELTAAVSSIDLEEPGESGILVVQSTQGPSNVLPFTVSATPFSAMVPDAAVAGDGNTLLTVTGSCYESGAEILWDGSPLTTTFVNATTLTATIPAALLASAGVATVQVRNANGNVSSQMFFGIEDPLPTVSSVAPNSSYPPCAPINIAVTGQNFIGADEIVFNGSSLSTTFVNSTTLTATVGSGYLSTPGSVSVLVVRPEVTTSNSVPFVINATPLDSLAPNSAAAGDADTLLTVTGSCYESGAEILWNGAPLPTTFVNSTTLTATIPAANLAAAGAAAVRVRNANDNISATLPFPISPQTPSITMISPTVSYPPCAPFDITVTGQNFSASSEVHMAGLPLATTFVNATQLIATVTSANLGSQGSQSVIVREPAQADSNSVSFLVRPTPLDGISPDSAVAGSGATLLTVTGSCYETGAAILWNGSPLATTFVNSTTLTATIPPGNMANPGSAQVSVRNANGNTSATLAFTIGDPPPTLTSINPTSSYPPCAAFDITLNGSGFSPASTVYMGASQLAASFINSGQMTATVTSALLATPGSVAVLVRKPMQPDSNSLPFIVSPTPLAGIAPASALTGSSAAQLTVSGDCFEAGATVLWNGAPLATSFVNATTLNATIPAGNLTNAGSAQVSVRNANDNTSTALPFTIGYPAPIITSLVPMQANVGSSAVTVSINGSGFSNMATVLLDGGPLPPSAVQFLNSSLLQITVPGSALSATGAITVEVLNPNTAASNPLDFGVVQANAVVPERVRPAEGLPPCAPFDITVEGRNLPFNGTVVLAGIPLVTTPGNGAQLIATVTSAALATPGTVRLVVRTPNQPDSSALPFLVRPIPLQGIQPATASIGSPDITLEVRGDCFEAGATVLWNGAPLATTFASPTTVTAVVPAANLAAAGVAQVSVRNAHGNTSVSFPFRVGPPPGANPTPVITTLAPPEAIAGAASATVAVTGSNFDAQATVLLDGVPAAKANVLWLNPGRLTLTLTAADLTSSRSITVEVQNADGAISNPAQFLVRPAITGVTPSTWTVGRPCDLFIAGRGFAPSSEALIDGPAGPLRVAPTETPTSTQMNVCVPTPQVSAPGRIQVRVCTPGTAGEVCSDPFLIDVASGLTITQLRPMSAPAGSATLCMAVDVMVAGGDPGALVARWDGADLPPGAAQCLAVPAPQPAVTEVAQGVFTTTVLAQVDAALLATPRPRDPAVPCSADPLAPKITAFAARLQAESAAACFDITALRPTLQPPTLGPGPSGCVTVAFSGQRIHRSAEVTVDGLQGGFCSGGEPMISGCGLDGADSSICNQVTLIVPSGTGVINVHIRNPDAVCPNCPPQTFTVDIQQARTELPPESLSLLCGEGSAAFPRTPVGSQSRLSCEISNISDARGGIGELAVLEPFSVGPGDCAEAFLEPGGSCAVELRFDPVRAGLFTTELTLTNPDGAAASLGRYLGVGILRSAVLSILADGLTPSNQSAVRIETDGAEGSEVLVLLRQSLRLASSVPVFPAGEGTPDVDCGFAAAVVGVEYSQPLVAACDTANASWEATPLDGGSWAGVNGDVLSGTPTETGVFDYEIRLSPAFPSSSAAVTHTCSITVVDAPLANGSASGSAPLMPCTSAQFAMGGGRQQVPLEGDGPTDVAFQTGTLSGDLRFIASFEADGVDVSPPPSSSGGAASVVEADASIALQAPVISAATFSCPTGSQLVVESSGYSSTREIASMRFDFQPAAGATGALQLGGDAATRPDLVSAFQTRYGSGSGAGELDGGFQMRAIFTINGRTADIGGVTLTLQNSVGGATRAATGSCQ